MNDFVSPTMGNEINRKFESSGGKIAATPLDYVAVFHVPCYSLCCFDVTYFI